MNSKPSKPLSLAFAGLLFQMMTTPCRAQVSKEEKLRSYMESTPFVAPMGYEDHTDPQIGYTHSPSGIDGGEFLFVKAGDYRSADHSSPKQIGFKKIRFYGGPQPDLVPGFQPKVAACKYGLRKPGQWNCLLFQSTNDAQAYFKSDEKSPTSYVVCRNCKPRPVPMLTRICPGVYSSSLDKASDWQDPTIPGPVFTKGMCTFKLPWWRTADGIKLGIRKYGGKIN